ncbi:YopX family protein [Brevibacillus ruminantium]|uniref:YopX family protein n=1 Tax=Brevibacillus ruminantium TaxID=2950604 RepID=A0ABY4WGC8_9BACL|nr:YopX family protein [Brevibacillus ruminantium]USG65183.1 YopX family protein [Brevibacillus ruminantium]
MQAGREIKFQVWDQDTRKMWTWEDIIEAESAMFITLLEFLQQDQFIKRQFTGLRDKNGKEIYEGDIALIYGDRCVIEYDSKSASYVARTKIDSYWALDEETFKLGVEVIGNIYENPDLLEVGK